MVAPMEKCMTRRDLVWLWPVWVGSALGIILGVAQFIAMPNVLHASEQTVTARKLIDTKSALSTAVADGSHGGNCRESAVYVDWGTNVTSGAVTVETAVDQNYTGTWAPLQVVTFSATAPKQDVVQVTGVHWAIRTRISTVVAGGTINTWLVCN